MVLVSIIVPIYQSANTLSKCIDSIINQTYTDFELLLVDDGSTDNSKEICLRWREKDDRIKYVYQENKGVSAARNLGLELAKGKWIVFIDSDDWIEPTYLEHFNLTEQPYDFILSGYKELVQGTTIEHYPPTPMNVQGKIQETTQYIFDLEISKLLNAPWGKVFLKGIIECNSLRFNPEYSYGEDKLFVLSYLRYCDSWKILQSAHYHYNRGNGLAQKLYPYTIIWKWNEELLHLFQVLGQKFSISEKQLKTISQNSYCYFTLYMINSIYQYKYSRTKRLSIIRAIYSRKRNSYSFRASDCNGKAMTIGILCYQLNQPWLTDIIYQIAYKISPKGLIR